MKTKDIDSSLSKVQGRPGVLGIQVSGFFFIQVYGIQIETTLIFGVETQVFVHL